MSEPTPTYGDGQVPADDVIQAADYTGYTSYSDYFKGQNGVAPEWSLDAGDGEADADLSDDFDV